MKRITDILERGMMMARRQVEIAMWKREQNERAARAERTANRMARDMAPVAYDREGGYTDAEGNYWGWAWGRDGNRVRVCIPAR